MPLFPNNGSVQTKTGVSRNRVRRVDGSLVSTCYTFCCYTFLGYNRLLISLLLVYTLEREGGVSSSSVCVVTSLLEAVVVGGTDVKGSRVPAASRVSIVSARASSSKTLEPSVVFLLGGKSSFSSFSVVGNDVLEEMVSWWSSLEDDDDDDDASVPSAKSLILLMVVFTPMLVTL